MNEIIEEKRQSYPYRGFRKRLENVMIPIQDATPATPNAIPVYNPTKTQIKNLVEDQKDQERRKDPLKKRKKYIEEKHIYSISDSNLRFNQKLSKDFDSFTADIKSNLERGSAP